MENQLRWFFLLLLFFGGFSCSKNSTPVPTPDTTVPTISLIDPTPGKTFVLGIPMHLQMDLSDNAELKSYKVVIVKSLKGVQTSDWGFTQTWTIAAGKKTFNVNHTEITVPLTVTGNQTTLGNYDMTVTCLDTSNNEASKTLTIVLIK